MYMYIYKLVFVIHTCIDVDVTSTAWGTTTVHLYMDIRGLKGTRSCWTFNFLLLNISMHMVGRWILLSHSFHVLIHAGCCQNVHVLISFDCYCIIRKSTLYRCGQEQSIYYFMFCYMYVSLSLDVCDSLWQKNHKIE